jgi:hypothetical protein
MIFYQLKRRNPLDFESHRLAETLKCRPCVEGSSNNQEKLSICFSLIYLCNWHHSQEFTTCIYIYIDHGHILDITWSPPSQTSLLYVRYDSIFKGGGHADMGCDRALTHSSSRFFHGPSEKRGLRI